MIMMHTEHSGDVRDDWLHGEIVALKINGAARMIPIRQKGLL